MTVQEVIGKWNYKLKIPRWRIHPTFHISLLSRYNQTREHGPSYANPPPDQIEGAEEYVVKAIVSHNAQTPRRYLIRWQGYSSVDDTWEPETNLENARDILNAYKRRNKLK